MLSHPFGHLTRPVAHFEASMEGRIDRLIRRFLEVLGSVALDGRRLITHAAVLLTLALGALAVS